MTVSLHSMLSNFLLLCHKNTHDTHSGKASHNPVHLGPSKILCCHRDGKYWGKAERRVSLCRLCFSFRSHCFTQPGTAALTDGAEGGEEEEEGVGRDTPTETPTGWAPLRFTARDGCRHFKWQSKKSVSEAFFRLQQITYARMDDRGEKSAYSFSLPGGFVGGHPYSANTQAPKFVTLSNKFNNSILQFRLLTRAS